MSSNHTETMNQSLHEFFYTVGVATTTGIAYYIWNNFYPITLNRLITDTAWWAVRCQTRATMMYERVENILYPWVTVVLPEKERPDVRFYLNGVEVSSMSYLEALKYEEDDFSEEYNKVTYEIYDDNNKSDKLVMIRDSVNDIMDKGLKKSNVHFISVSLKREGKDDVDIDMSSKGNIYMIGNELFSESFLGWILPDIDLSEDYTISTIDDNVNMVSFSKNQYIVLNENGYDVKTLESKENDEDTEAKKEMEKNNSGLFSWFNTNKAKDE
uniref:Uncharacterized protein n=1 Tax=viral metagenome TaxID=1070528 RepID=A0A6C0CQD2_9ZZZZ